jgi:hypothetical protein
MVAETVPLAPVAVAPLQPPPSPSQSTESRPHQKDGTVTPPDAATAATTPAQTTEKVAAPAPAPAAAPAAAPAEVTPAPVPAPSTTPGATTPLNGKQKPIQRDAGQAVLRGTLRGGAFEGRWGFGRDAVETSAFRYDARTPGGDVYDGGFDLKQLTGNLRVDEALSLTIADAVDGRRTIKCVGDNRFGHFEMSGSCLEDGTDCVLVRIYAPKQVARPRRRAAPAPKREPSQRARQPTKRRKLEKYGGKEPRFDPEGKDEVRSARTPSTRRGQVDARRGLDVGRPLAEVFEAVAAAQKNGRVPVLTAPSRSIEEASRDIKELLEPSSVPDATRERLQSPQPQKPRSGKLRPFGCFDGATAATTLLSEIDYERCLRDFQDAFEKGHLTDFWLAVENRLTQALEQAEAEGALPQIVRLDCGDGKGATALTPPPVGRLRRSLQKPDNAPEARGDLEPTNPGAYHVNTIAGGFGTASFAGIDGLAQGGKELASQTRCVALDTRVRVGSELDDYCNRLAATACVEKVCPSSDGWRFGPRGQTLAGDEDRRHYLIAGWPGGLTPTHCDFGVQAVFYHTLAGKNRVLGVPRPVAACLHASREALVYMKLGGEADARLLQFEADALLGCLNRGLLQYDEFGPGETMLILPRGGHAVLTGRPHKVVLAGEWHLTPDGVRAAAIPRTYAQRRMRTRRDASKAREAAAAKRRSVESNLTETEDESQDEAVVPAPAPIHTEVGRIAVYVEDARHSALETGRADVDGERGPGFAAVAAAAARQANPRSKTVLHLRPSWTTKRWASCDAWDRVALEADVEAARSLGVAEVVACPVTSKGVLDGAWCGKLADAAKPSCQLVLGLPVDEDTLIRAKSVGVAGVVVAGENAELEQLCRASSWSYAVVQP